jgi:hypothetical protein
MHFGLVDLSMQGSNRYIFSNPMQRTSIEYPTHVHQIINQFWNFHFNKWNIPKYLLFSFTTFFDLEEIIFENFNIYENNIISVELAKVLRYCLLIKDAHFLTTIKSQHSHIHNKSNCLKSYQSD